MNFPLIKMPFIFRQVVLSANFLMIGYFALEKYTSLELFTVVETFQPSFVVLAFLLIGVLFMPSITQIEEQRKKLSK